MPVFELSELFFEKKTSVMAHQQCFDVIIPVGAVFEKHAWKTKTPVSSVDAHERICSPYHGSKALDAPLCSAF